MDTILNEDGANCTLHDIVLRCGSQKMFCMLPTQTKHFLTYHIGYPDITSYNICDVALARWTKPPPKCFSQKLKRLLGHFPRNQQWRLATLLCLERLFSHTELQKVKQNARLSAFQALHQKFFLGGGNPPQDYKGAASMATRRLRRSEPSISPMKPGKILSDAHMNPDAKSATTSELKEN